MSKPSEIDYQMLKFVHCLAIGIRSGILIPIRFMQCRKVVSQECIGKFFLSRVDFNKCLTKSADISTKMLRCEFVNSSTRLWHSKKENRLHTCIRLGLLIYVWVHNKVFIWKAPERSDRII